MSGQAALTLGWVREWAYYTSYFEIWKVSVPSAHVFWAMLRNNFGLVVQAPADLFLAPLLVSDTMPGRTLVLLVTAVSVAGVVRQALVQGWKPIHYILPFYLALILLWNYPDASNRFFIPFCFLFVAGLWLEARRVLVLLRTKLFVGAATRPEKLLAIVFGTAIVAVGVGMIVNYVNGRRRDLYALSQQRETILKAKQDAYRWLAEQHCCSPVLAYEDVNVYLYTGRTAMRPIILPTSSIYDPQILADTLNHTMDVDRALKASYWFFSDDDYRLESEIASTALRNCLGQTGPTDWQMLFKSQDGRVVVRAVQAVSYINSFCAGNDR